MPRYEIVAHVVRDLECDTAEDAAAIFRRQLQAEARPTDTLVHLAVWREATDSALPPSLRGKLAEFFAAVERSAGEAEQAFRGRVEAILLGSGTGAGDEAGGNRAGSPDPNRQT